MPIIKERNDLGTPHTLGYFFLIFHTFLSKFGRVRRGSGGEKYREMYGKLEKLTERLLAKRHPSNLVNKIFYLVF